jgi:hypothetical protein
MHELGPLLGGTRRKRCPLNLKCVRTALAPRGSRFTISQIGEKIGTPSSQDTDDVTQALCSGGNPRRLGWFARRQFALLKRHKTYWFALGHEADLLRLLPKGTFVDNIRH